MQLEQNEKQQTVAQSMFDLEQDHRSASDAANQTIQLNTLNVARTRHRASPQTGMASNNGNNIQAPSMDSIQSQLFEHNDEEEMIQTSAEEKLLNGEEPSSRLQQQSQLVVPQPSSHPAHQFKTIEKKRSKLHLNINTIQLQQREVSRRNRAPKGTYSSQNQQLGKQFSPRNPSRKREIILKMKSPVTFETKYFQKMKNESHKQQTAVEAEVLAGRLQDHIAADQKELWTKRSKCGPVTNEMTSTPGLRNIHNGAKTTLHLYDFNRDILQNVPSNMVSSKESGSLRVPSPAPVSGGSTKFHFHLESKQQFNFGIQKKTKSSEGEAEKDLPATEKRGVQTITLTSGDEGLKLGQRQITNAMKTSFDKKRLGHGNVLLPYKQQSSGLRSPITETNIQKSTIGQSQYQQALKSSSECRKESPKASKKQLTSSTFQFEFQFDISKQAQPKQEQKHKELTPPKNLKKVASSPKKEIISQRQPATTTPLEELSKEKKEKEDQPSPNAMQQVFKVMRNVAPEYQESFTGWHLVNPSIEINNHKHSTKRHVMETSILQTHSHLKRTL